MSDTKTIESISLERYFQPFRENIVGINHSFNGPFGKKKIVYADWTASGRIYGPVEEKMSQEIFPFVANTHTETNFTGCTMTLAYHRAKQIIKDHVRAHESDILISSNSGMTGVINKLQRILGLRVHEKYRDAIYESKKERPVVFITHMEHHSNQTSWQECICDVVIINPNDEGRVCLNHFAELLEEYKDRKTKIAAITSCSNVTGLFTPFREIAKMIHARGGYCFVDFACSAPYIDIIMRPEEEGAHLDAIYFSPHKFLGGPGTTGILVFCPKLYKNKIPDNPGGGTVDWTNPWGEHKYLDEIEAREDGGTPAFLQTMKVALCTQLKDEIGTEKMIAREKEMISAIWPRLTSIPNLHILAEQHAHRLGVISFYIDDLHYNLGVKLLNDRYGIQVRGGCSCAGTYGHYLLEVDQDFSHSITDKINSGDLSQKPGWIRMSIHPTTTDEEVEYMCNAIRDLARDFREWSNDYEYNSRTNEFNHRYVEDGSMKELVDRWFGSEENNE